MNVTATRLGLLGMLLMALLVTGIGTGSSFLGPDRVMAALLGAGERMDMVIVWTLRLPRVALAALAGAALALSGALLQRATRNPLAAPSVLGITDGAAVGVLLFLTIFSDAANHLTVPVAWQPAFAGLGATSFALLVLLLGGKHRADPLRLLLYGVALAALAKAIVVLLLIVGPVYRASQALIWLAGSVQAAQSRDVVLLGSVLGLSLPVLILLARPLDQLRLDQDSAFATGLPVAAVRGAALALAVALAAGAVSVAGGIGFVGLLAPHAARLLFGSRAAPQLLGAALLGAAMTTGADLLVRLAFQPLEVPVGAVTAALGAPFFLWLLNRRGDPHA
jgi:iron complex transport system permease protein